MLNEGPHSAVQTSFENSPRHDQIKPFPLDTAPLPAEFSISELIDGTISATNSKPTNILASSITPERIDVDEDCAAIEIENLLPDEFGCCGTGDPSIDFDESIDIQDAKGIFLNNAVKVSDEFHLSGEVQKRRRIDSSGTYAAIDGRLHARVAENQAATLFCQQNELSFEFGTNEDNNVQAFRELQSHQNSGCSLGTAFPDVKHVSQPIQAAKVSKTRAMPDNVVVFKVPTHSMTSKSLRKSAASNSSVPCKLSREYMVQTPDEVQAPSGVDGLPELLPPPPSDEFFKSATAAQKLEAESDIALKHASLNDAQKLDLQRRDKQQSLGRHSQFRSDQGNQPKALSSPPHQEQRYLSQTKTPHNAHKRKFSGEQFYPSLLTTQACGSESSSAAKLQPVSRTVFLQKANAGWKKNDDPHNYTSFFDHSNDKRLENPHSSLLYPRSEWDFHKPVGNEIEWPGTSELNHSKNTDHLRQTPLGGDANIGNGASLLKSRKRNANQALHTKAPDSTVEQIHLDENGQTRKRRRTRVEDLDPSDVYVCSFEDCRKKFAKKYNLKIHERRHRGDLPFICPQCAKKFMWQSSFERHLRVHEARAAASARRLRRGKEPNNFRQEERTIKHEFLRTSDSTWKLTLNGLDTVVNRNDRASVVLAMSLCTLNCIDDTVVLDALVVQKENEYAVQTCPPDIPNAIEEEGSNGNGMELHSGIDDLTKVQFMSEPLSLGRENTEKDDFFLQELTPGDEKLEITDPSELE